MAKDVKEGGPDLRPLRDFSRGGLQVEETLAYFNSEGSVLEEEND